MGIVNIDIPTSGIISKYTQSSGTPGKRGLVSYSASHGDTPFTNGPICISMRIRAKDGL